MSLIEAAAGVRTHAHAPYSGFKVGAAIRSSSGAVYLGCNVENAAYPEGTCAESGAVAAMVAAGDTRIAEVAIIADSPDPVTPCGGCRQRLREFSAPDVTVTMANLKGTMRTMRMDELLPEAFGPEQFDGR